MLVVLALASGSSFGGVAEALPWPTSHDTCC